MSTYKYIYTYVYIHIVWTHESGHMNASWHMNKSCHMNESWHINESWHMNESCHMSHTRRLWLAYIESQYVDTPYHNKIHASDVTQTVHSMLATGGFTYVTWLMHMCDMTHICVYRDPFMFLTSRHANCTRNARYCRFHVYICVNAPRYTRECTHQWVMNSYVCYDMCIQDSFIRVFTCVTWRIHMLIWLTDLLFVTLTLNQHVDTPCHNKINLSNPFEVMHNLYVNLIWGHGLHVSVSYHTCDTPYHNNIHGPLAYVWRDSCLHETLLIRTCNVTH